jgi:hypothetical protein
MRSAPLALLVVVALASSTGALAQVETQGTVVGNPNLEVVATENRLTWGDDQRLALAVTNAGRLQRGGPERFETRVTTARSLRVAVATDRLAEPLSEALVVRRDPAPVGELARGASAELSLAVGVADRLPPGTYDLPLDVTYRYTALVRYGTGDPLYTERTATELVSVPLVVTQQPRLAVAAVPNQTLAPGANGSVAFTLSNTGTRTAADVGVTVNADSPVYFGAPDARQTSLFVADLPPGASRTLSIPVGTRATATPATYLLGVSASYTTPEGFQRTADDLRLGVPVGPAEAGGAPTP